MMAVNEMQQMAINHIDGPMMVIAGPGSGKTFTITRRIANLIENGIDPKEILVITFTKASAIEMQERFIKLIGDEFSLVNFGTFHAIYFGILKEEYGFDASNIITEREKINLMKLVLDYENIEDDNSALILKLISDIGLIKNDGHDPDKFCGTYVTKEQFIFVFNEYEKLKRQNEKVDFEDMVLMCRRLFEDRPDILLKWRDRFKYILIDEFQDINPMQYEVIKMLCAPHNNLFIVGDDDQSIYGFRGSRPKIMLDFEKEFTNAKRVVLATNYRSSEKIVSIAQMFIRNNKSRFAKKLEAFNKGGTECVVKGYESKEEEYRKIIKLVKTIRRQSGYRGIALLFRTNEQARLLTGEFASNNIPFIFKEKPQNIFESEYGMDILAYLRCTNEKINRKDFIRIMNKPVRYIRRDFVGTDIVDLDNLVHNMKIPKYVRENIWRLRQHLECMKGMAPYAAINYIYKAIGYEAFLKDRYKNSENIIMKSKEALTFILESSKGLNNISEYFEYVEKYEMALKCTSTDQNDDAVVFCTMHGSKGLEYETVIIPDVNEGIIPSARIKTEDDLEEERRVFYVAMTRAKQKLYIYYLLNSKEKRITQSRFIDELQPKL